MAASLRSLVYTKLCRETRRRITLRRARSMQPSEAPLEYRAGTERAIENRWLVMHESGTYLRFTQAGADLFA